MIKRYSRLISIAQTSVFSSSLSVSTYVLTLEESMLKRESRHEE